MNTNADYLFILVRIYIIGKLLKYAVVPDPDASVWRVSLLPTFGNINVCSLHKTDTRCWKESHCF